MLRLHFSPLYALTGRRKHQSAVRSGAPSSPMGLLLYDLYAECGSIPALPGQYQRKPTCDGNCALVPPLGDVAAL